MERGWVYILTNRSMPGLVKIGFTKNPPESRARELYDTGVAYPFDVAYQVQCYRYQRVERAAHDYLENKRVNDKREFFACTVQEAIDAVLAVCGNDFIEATDFREKHQQIAVHLQAKSRIGSVKESQGIRIRHIALGGLVVMVFLVLCWLGFRQADEPKLTEAQQLIGYELAKIGANDVNLRSCSSTDCDIIAVLPKHQPVLIKADSRTEKHWIYAEFHGDVCYPQHYERGQGCRQWAENNIIEGWMYLPTLSDKQQVQDSSSLLDALF